MQLIDLTYSAALESAMRASAATRGHTFYIVRNRLRFAVSAVMPANRASIVQAYNGGFLAPSSQWN